LLCASHGRFVRFLAEATLVRIDVRAKTAGLVHPSTEILMPTPIDILLDPVTLSVLALFAGLMLWERLAPGRPLPRLRGWLPRALASFGAYLMLSTYLPLWWGEALAPVQLLDLSGWPTALAAAAGVFVYELGAYAYHRTLHAFTPLFRALHQMHHSAERLDVASAFWFSPLDMIGWTLVTSLTLTLVGLGAEAVTPAVLFITFLGIFQHANLRTPRWLGFLIQRPESHSLHHGRGVHRWNYADLPLVDMLFGTFRNPPAFAPETGFWPGASARVADMLLLRDVSVPPASPR
jgi:sterol desaturase/sphingolipid hydroxylase (fatty acid hydroxylase superfamily)